MTILVDIDGTVADCKHRLHYVLSKPKNYKAFFKGIPNDLPIYPVQEFVHIIMKSSENVLFVTARPEWTRGMSWEWLNKYLPLTKLLHSETCLLMREDKDFRKDFDTKKDLLEKVREMGYWPDLCLDDKLEVCEMYRKNGLVALQVGEPIVA